jgi:ABC-type bacteriocin/lantibiotic exporter with double-glycine peptidase domain
MDANTKDVLMALIALISAIVTPIVVVYVGKINAKKVDDYHKEVNGKMGLLLETTKQLATEKARADEEDAKKKK